MKNLFKTRWDKWKNLSIGKIQNHVYLLQYRKHANGKVIFRVEKSKDVWGVDVPSLEQIK